MSLYLHSITLGETTICLLPVSIARMIFALLHSLSLLEPETVAAHSVGEPWLAPVLRQISYLESRGKDLGVHPQDARHGSRMWRRAVKQGWLDPSKCPLHAQSGEDWAPRGRYGLSAAYSWRHFGDDACHMAPDLMSTPLVSALAAALHARYIDKKYHCSRSDWRRDECVRIVWAGFAKNPRGVVARWRHGGVAMRREGYRFRQSGPPE